MFLPQDIRCTVCSNIFCCVNCRHRHEQTAHVLQMQIRQNCDICNGTPFILKNIIDDQLIKHIIMHHLPLQCNKCSKIFEKEHHFSGSDVCQKTTTIITTKTSSVKFENKENKPILNESPQHLETIPELSLKSHVSSCELNAYIKCGNNLVSKFKNNNNNNCEIDGKSPSPPVGIVNQRTKEFENGLCNVHVKPVENSNNNVTFNKTVSPKKKLTRTTSTPMHFMFIHEEIKQHMVFDSSSSCHLSSIGSISENVSAPQISEADSNSTPPINSSSSYILKKPQRAKLPVSATPLRQLMSKSIQRAIAERNKSIDSDRSSIKFNNVVMTPPLDLRTTPVLRRTVSLGSREYIKDFRKLEISHSESKVSLTQNKFIPPVVICPSRNIPRNKNFETCQQGDDYATPKFSSIPTGNLKKAISFTSPITPNESPILEETHSRLDPGATFCTIDKSDIWYTPSSDPIPRSYSTSIIEEFKIAREITLDTENDFNDDGDPFRSAFEGDHISHSYKEPIETENKNAKNRFWSLLATTMMKIKGGLRGQPKVHSHNISAIKKYASFSGWEESVDNNRESTLNESVKRSRSDMSNVSPNSDNSDANESIKRKKIHGRRPINRMRKM